MLILAKFTVELLILWQLKLVELVVILIFSCPYDLNYGLGFAVGPWVKLGLGTKFLKKVSYPT